MIVIINSMHYSKPLNKYTRHRYLPGLAYFSYIRPKPLSLVLLLLLFLIILHKAIATTEGNLHLQHLTRTQMLTF